jgi:UDP-glucose 4-epimerase
MILITGASGFIGKHLLEYLTAKYGRENIVALTSQPIGNVQCVLHNSYRFADDIFIKHGFENIETVIHAGSFIPKNGNEINNIHLSNSNISTTEVLIGAQLPNLKKVIYLSTIDVYNSESIITEQTLESPVSMYAHSKLYIEKMLQNWANQEKKVVQILRIGHVYGPGEEAYAKLIPETFRKILLNQDLTIWGSGNELRSFIYIYDLVKSITKSIEYTENLGVINIVGSQPISIFNLVKKIKSIANSSVAIEKAEVNFQGKNSVFDNQKSLKFLLDKETNLDDGLLAEYQFMKQSKL